jgi:hypothetical protein
MQHHFCRMCDHERKITAATVVDHIVAHRGNSELFWNPDNWQPLCQHHHNSAKQSEERSINRGVDDAGIPKNPDHPWNKVLYWGYSIPYGLKPSCIPVHLVCGAPGAGKSTFVREHANPGDVIIDMDAIRRSLGFPQYSGDLKHLKIAMRERDRMIRSLATATTGQAWLIVSAPTDDERAQWCEALGNVTVHSIDTPKAECIRRIMQDPAREGEQGRMIRTVEDYFRKRAPALPRTSQGSPSLSGCVWASPS